MPVLCYSSIYKELPLFKLTVFYPGREFKEPDGTVRTETRYTYSEYVHTLLILSALALQLVP